MYLVQLQYKNSKYDSRKNVLYHQEELINIFTIYKGSDEIVKDLSKHLNTVYYSKTDKMMCLFVENKDQLCLLLVDKFIIRFFGECYNSKDGFEMPSDYKGASEYLESISNQLKNFNIDNIDNIFEKNKDSFELEEDSESE